jgi:hypothetical protein
MTDGSSWTHFRPNLFSLLKDPGLEPLYNHAIGTLHLALGLWMCNSWPIHMDVVVIAEFLELYAGELGAGVGYDGVWYPEPMDDVCEEQHNLLGSKVGDGACLNPL